MGEIVFRSLFCEDFLKSCKAGKTVFEFAVGLSGNKGKSVICKVRGNAVVLGSDPLKRDLLLEVRNAGKRKENVLAGVLPVDHNALEADHISGLAGDSCLNGLLACGEALGDIGLAGKVSAAALEKAELNSADLCAGLFLNDISKEGGETAKLSVAEAVSRAGLRLGDEGTVGVVDALGNGYDALSVGVVNALNVSKELVHIKVDLGNVDKVGTAANGGSEGGGSGKPSGMTTHYLNDSYHSGVINAGIFINLGDGGGDILRG